MNGLKAAAALAAALLAARAGAQAPVSENEGIAQFYSYRVADRAAFEAGYRAHLGWHARNGDPLIWYAWTVQTGPRRGLFVDATAGTSFSALDRRVKPAEDGADFRRTAASHAVAVDVETWELWAGVSTATPLEDKRPSAIVDVFRIDVAPGDTAAFERAMTALATPRGQAGVQLSWYRRLRGGDGPAYFAMLARENWAGLGAAGGTFAAMLARAYGASEGEVDKVLGEVSGLSVESWTYEPRLSLIPGAPLAL
ncbi:hypothetical protein [Sphingopyxis flava]|uniref:NIPSNAP protein n=1 Tax=Sphingopyxis flava TaxID=1507287 RepID=A0A1T5BBQ1_9SPHN|nr:hypothetical protein [Sphingopyxis flava]SKB44648.1 hypothetical protein SAMN06295937_100676 [Sphingopyxis flava]